MAQKCPALPALHIVSQHDVELSPQRLWESLNDPQILQQCIKGCDKLERVSATEFHATFKVRVGPFQKAFHAQLNIVNAKPPTEYHLLSTMEAGIAGKLSGVAEVKMQQISSQKTRLCYDAQVSIDGWLGELGAKTLGNRAEHYMQKFFDRLIALSAKH